MTAFLIWTDYEACEVFLRCEDAENYCYNNYGPDEKTWPTIDERDTPSIERQAASQYVAIAWWPNWTYERPPQVPYVTSAYGQRPHMYENDGNGHWFEAQEDEKISANDAAKKLAMAAIPSYRYAQSSRTSSGQLDVWRREDYQGKVGSE